MKKQTACMMLAAVLAVQSMSSVSMAASMPENGQEAVGQAQEQVQEDTSMVQDADSGSAVVTQGKCGASAEYVLYGNGILKISGSGKIDDCLPEPNSDNYVKPWGKSYEEQYNGMIKEVRIDDGITEIGDAVFAQCSNLEFVTMCDSVSKIGKFAFADCDRLWTVELSGGITSIGKYAFSGCEELSSIGDFSENLTDIGEGILEGCDQAVAMVASGSAAEEYCKKNSISYNYSDNGNAPMIVASGTCANGITWTLNAEWELHFSGNGELQGVESLEAESPSWWTYTYMTNSVVIDRGINAIGANAFYGFLNIQKLYLGKGVNKIGDHAFQGCTNLKTLEIPDNVAAIGKMAFADCSSLQTIIFDGMAVQVEEYPETEKPFYGVNADVRCKMPGLWTEAVRETLGGNLNWQKRGLVIEDGLPHVYDENGTLIRNATPVIDGKKYYVDGDGVAQTGWIRLADWQMYFYPESYAAATGITHIDGKAYLFDENGVEILRSRTEVINGRKYWFQPDGSLMSGWCRLGNWTMYFDPQIYAGARGICEIDGTPYVFDENGVLIKGGTPLIDGRKYYADANGMARSGWLRLADWQMYFDPETYTAAVGITHIDGKAYLFDENGVEILKSRTEVINGKKYWFQPDGSLLSGWCVLGDWRMYFEPDTYEAAIGVHYINGTRYEFDENGVLIEYSSYIGSWIAVQGNTEIRVRISGVLDNRVWGSAEVHSRTSDRVADIDFSGTLDQNGTLTCSYSEDGWGARGLLKLTLQKRSVHLYTQETGYSSDYTGEWSFGNQNVILSRETETSYSSYRGTWYCNDGEFPLNLEISQAAGSRISARVSGDGMTFFTFDQAEVSGGIAAASYTDPYGNSGQVRLEFLPESIQLHVNEWNHVSGDEYGWWVFNGATFTR